MTALQHQEGGSHYKGMAIQPVEFIHRNRIGFIEGCVIKYCCRWREKGGVEDLKKARHFRMSPWVGRAMDRKASKRRAAAICKRCGHEEHVHPAARDGGCLVPNCPCAGYLPPWPVLVGEPRGARS